MNAYEDFLSICDWGETLAEQRDRILSEILTPQQLEQRQAFFDKHSNNKITQSQLSMFDF